MTKSERKSMRTFTKEKKTALLREIKKHREADQIIKGSYGEENGTWKGCAVGCSVRSLNILEGKNYKTNDHTVYEKELGIPVELAYLEDELFEAMPLEQALFWPERFIKAVPTGADLSHVIAKLVIWQFEDAKYGLKNIKEVKDDKEIYGFCEDVVALYKRSLTEEVQDDEYYQLYLKIERAEAEARAWVRARAWAWAWAWARGEAEAGDWARARAWVRAGTRSWAGVGARAWARAWADYEKYVLITADKLIELMGDEIRFKIV